MQPGCVELLSHPSSHMQELKKKKKKESSSVLKMTALLSSKNFSLNYSRFTPCHWISLERRRLKGNQYWKTLEMLCSSLEVSERLQLGNTAYFFKYTTEFWKIQSPEEQTLQHFLKLNCQKKELFFSIRWQGIGDLGRRSLGILKYQIFLLLQKVFTSFFQPGFGVNEISLTLSVSMRERRSLGEVSTSLKSVSPTLIASDAFQRYFQTTLNAMPQKCWVKGKVAKILYVPTHFLFFFLYLEFERKVFLKPQTVKCPAERSHALPVPSPQSLFTKGSLRVHLEKTCSDPGIGCTRSRVLGGVRLGGCQPFHPWFQGLRRQSKPNPLSTPYWAPHVSVAHFFLPLSFPLLSCFPFSWKQIKTPTTKHPPCSSISALQTGRGLNPLVIGLGGPRHL